MSRRSRLRAALVLILGASSLVSACSTSGASSDPSLAATGLPASASAPASPSGSPVAAFPVTVTDDEGTDVAIAGAPERIVSLSPANTEILYELGAGERIVATDSSSDFPEAAAALPDVADFSSLDVEQVVALDADLVVAAGLGFTPADAVAQLRDLDIPVIVVYAASVDGVYDDIELIGAAIGAGDAAAELTASLRAEIQAIHAAVSAAGTPPRVFYEIGYTDATGQIFAPADQSFVAEMVTLAGGDVITTGDPNDYEIPLETLIERDPEIIVLGVNPFYEPTPEAVAARTGWDVMTAVRNGDVRPVRDIEITRPGPRLPVGLRNLAAAIWPDVALPAAQ